MTYYDLDSWYEPDVEPETPADHGWVHEDNIPDIGLCKDMLEGLIKAIYKTGNIAALEDCLDELTSQFDLKIPKTTPVLEDKASEHTDRLLGDWLKFNQAYNENLLETVTPQGE